MVQSTDYFCVSSEGPTNNAGFGAIMDNVFWYPSGVGEWSAHQGRTYEIFFYVTGESGATNQILRRTTENGAEGFSIGYQISGNSSGSNWWRIVKTSPLGGTTAGFSFPLITREWYRLVIRTMYGTDTTSAPAFNSSANKMIVQIGRVGVKSDGTTSAGADTFPFGVGANGGFGQAFALPAFTLDNILPIKPFGGANPSGSALRCSWGGRMGVSPTLDPTFTERWRGGYCEERLWFNTLTDAQIAAGLSFLPVTGMAVYIRFNEQLTGLHTQVTAEGTPTVGNQVGFTDAGTGGPSGFGDTALINHVDPAITTSGRNPTGFPAHPFKSVQTGVLQNSGTYSVLSDEPLTTLGAYKVAAPIPTVRSGSYTVKSDDSIDKDGAYSVLDPEEIVRFGAYLVLQDPLQIDRDGAYSVTQGTTPIVNSGDYSVVTQDGVTRKEGSYSVLSDDAVVNEGAYSVLDLAPITAIGAYSVTGIAPLQITAFGDYSVQLDQPQIEAEGAYSVDIDTPQIQAEGAYSVNGQADTAQIQRSGAYSVRNEEQLLNAALRKLAWERQRR